MLKNVIMVTFVALFVLLLFGSVQLYGQIPQLINFQGVLTDPATGNGLTGTYTITFSIYDAATGGTALWTEIQTVTVTNGLFNVLLGNVTSIPLDLFEGSDRYLGIKIGNDPEMTPRQKLVSVGYAFRANNAGKFLGKDTSDFVRTNQQNSISTDMVQNNAITAAKVAPKILSSINNVSNDGGNVDLVAGSNVTITPDDENNRITISATGGGSSDNLGDHTATQNLKMNGHWISGDGDNEGVFVQSDGLVNIGSHNQSTPYAQLYVQKKNSSNTWQHGITTLNPNLQSGQNIIITAGKNSSNKNMGNIYFHYTGNQSNLNRLSLGFKGVNDILNVTAGGKVGIGKSNPSVTLDVAGTIASNSIIMAEGNIISHGIITAKEGSYVRSPEGILGGEYAVHGLGGFTAIMGETDEPNGTGVVGECNTGDVAWGIYGQSNTGYAGYFWGDTKVDGDMIVSGTLTKGGGAFKIDHPLDPANKYLLHSFVESPDMKNIYDGVVILDDEGKAVVQLPEWFEVLNKDFRYQLTPIGGSSPNLYIEEKISNNQFKIAGGKAGLEVSWMVTGIRKDAWANAHRIPVELMKDNDEKGKFLYPEELGYSKEMSVNYSQEEKARKIAKKLSK